MGPSGIDVAVVIYAVTIFARAQWVSRTQGREQKDAADYWW